MAKIWDDEKKCYVSDITPVPAFEPSASKGPDSSWTKAKLVEHCEDNDIEFNSGDTKQDLLDKIDG